jgi:hypothetical protein
MLTSLTNLIRQNKSHNLEILKFVEENPKHPLKHELTTLSFLPNYYYQAVYEAINTIDYVYATKATTLEELASSKHGWSCMFVASDVCYELGAISTDDPDTYICGEFNTHKEARLHKSTPVKWMF